MKPVHVFNVIPRCLPRSKACVNWLTTCDGRGTTTPFELFRRLEPTSGNRTGHNPVLMLGTIDQEQLEAAAKDESFLAQLDRLVKEMASYLSAESTWYRRYVRSDGQAAWWPISRRNSG